jgi:hypothetical protein
MNVKTTDLGMNIFDSDRKKATNVEDFMGTETSFNSSSKVNTVKSDNEKISYLKDTEDRKKNIDLVKKEFGALADLLNVKSTNDDEIFNLDLFVKKKNTKKQISTNIKGKIEEDEGDQYDENYIDIERDLDGIEKVKKMFDNFDVNAKDNNNEADDLLDLMDMAANK